MRKWIYDNPWIWVAVFLTLLVLGSLVVVVIAEQNKPELVKDKKVSLVTSDPKLLGAAGQLTSPPGVIRTHQSER